MERNDTCWQKFCNAPCKKDFLYCGNQNMEGYASWNQTGVDGLKSSCEPDDQNKQFDFGIFQQALSSGIAASKNFITKYCYCLWWGLQNLRYVISYLKKPGIVSAMDVKRLLLAQKFFLGKFVLYYYTCMFLLLHPHSHIYALCTHAHVEKNRASCTKVDEKFPSQISLKCQFARKCTLKLIRR